MLRSGRSSFKSSKNKYGIAWWMLIGVMLLLSLLCWCLLAVSVDHIMKPTLPINAPNLDTSSLTIPNIGGNHVSEGLNSSFTSLLLNINNTEGNHPWDIYRLGDKNNLNSTSVIPGIGPEAIPACQSTICRMCNTMMLHNSNNVIHPSVLEYIKKYVVIGVVTGSYDNFSRVDLALCTWLGHIPKYNLFIFTDAANMSDRRHGVWIETDNTEISQKLHKGMLKNTGYSLGWMRAQYRFFHAFNFLASLVLNNNNSDIDNDYYRNVRWSIVVDDDSFLDIHALVRFLHRRDLSSISRLISQSKSSTTITKNNSTIIVNLQERCRRWVNATPTEIFSCISLPEKWNKLLKQQLKRNNKENSLHYTLHDPDSPALQIGTSLWNITNQFLINPLITKILEPLYIGDHGWGGAGHYMNTAALPLFSHQSHNKCIYRYLIRGKLASDTTLHRCLPSLGIHRTSDKVISHCQARFLQERMLNGELVSMHIKRDVVPPNLLAIWRIRLYYQIIYHRNRTAYEVLMRVGACAYGYTCKLHKCGKREDEVALSEFVKLSSNNSYVPIY